MAGEPNYSQLNLADYCHMPLLPASEPPQEIATKGIGCAVSAVDCRSHDDWIDAVFHEALSRLFFALGPFLGVAFCYSPITEIEGSYAQIRRRPAGKNRYFIRR